MSPRRFALSLALAALAGAPAAGEETSPSGRETIRIARAASAIVVDGRLDESAWTAADPIDKWYQISPGGATEPKVRTRAWMAFDDAHLYVAFEMDDPDPSTIRAPLTDRDNALSSSDYAGIVIDGVDDGKTAQEFLVNPRGVQYDAIWSDIAGESLAPNFHYDAAARIHESGWTLEMRIPFASIRYVPGPEPVWGVTLFRNWPRERRYEFATATQPTACFICNENRLVGLEGLPPGGAWVLAPYVTARRSERPRDGVVGASLVAEDEEIDGGFDLKWNPSARHTVDLTFQPDFSQVETDVPQIATNQRFALFFPERRPFFLEQVDLFSTPISAVYTRTVTDPRAGLRATGRFGSSAYTFLVAEDLGGGSVVIPGATGSRLAEQAFESDVILGRLRHDLGPDAYLSFVVTSREIEGGGSHRLFGPDFQWSDDELGTLTGQVLWSRSETPVLPEIVGEWDGRELSGSAAYLRWDSGARGWGWSLTAQDVDGEFRADNGFVPRVGFRQLDGLLGRGRPLRGDFLTRLRFFVRGQASEDEDGERLTRVAGGGVDLFGQRAFWMRVEGVEDEQRVDGRLLTQSQARLRMRLAPTGTLADFELAAFAGSSIDFANAREGDGWGATLAAVLRSPRHLELRIDAARQVLEVDDPLLGSGELFTADALSGRVFWTFTPSLFVRVIAQIERTRRDPALYTFRVERESEDVEASILVAYKLDWQSVIYLGYGDSRTLLAATGEREQTGRELFFKLSYAIQRR